jgi:integrase
MLTDSKIRAAKPKDKPYKLTDAFRLYVHVSIKGTKKFKLDYNLDGKNKTFTLGDYPALSLAEARELASEARKLIARGIPPNNQRSTSNFQQVALEYCDLKEWDEMHKQRRRLELYAFPFIGQANLQDINPPDVLYFVRKIEEKGTNETAHRTLNLIGQIFRYAVSCGYVQADITRDLKGALKPVKGNHFTAIVDADEIRQVYKQLDLIPSIITRNAIKMAILTAARPGDLRLMRWDDVDLKKRQWSFIAAKTQYPIIIPLSDQAVELIKEVGQYTSFNTYVFSSLRGGDKDRALSNTALLMALQRLGINSTVHGFRAAFRSVCDEVLDYPPHLLEQCLGHMVKDTHGRAYNRTTHLVQRVEIMQRWADFLTNAHARDK